MPSERIDPVGPRRDAVSPLGPPVLTPVDREAERRRREQAREERRRRDRATAAAEPAPEDGEPPRIDVRG